LLIEKPMADRVRRAAGTMMHNSRKQHVCTARNGTRGPVVIAVRDKCRWRMLRQRRTVRPLLPRWLHGGVFIPKSGTLW
jgi:hypothetical protein